MRKVELYERIRRDHAEHGWSIRRLAKEHRVHRREVRQALHNALPPPPAPLNRPRPVLGPLTPVIEAILEQDREAPRKQRHSAHRIWERLVSEQGAGIAEATVRRYVGARKRELYGASEVMVPQVHEPGQEAEVDLSESWVEFGWGRQKVNFFEMRACASGAAFHWPLRAVTQQAFLEAHVRAFEHFGGSFARVRYDNLSAAVHKVLQGRQRQETERFVVLRSHYLFKAVSCLPGKRGAHEKGGIEGEVGWFRRNRLVPVPAVKGVLATMGWSEGEAATIGAAAEIARRHQPRCGDGPGSPARSTPRRACAACATRTDPGRLLRRPKGARSGSGPGRDGRRRLCRRTSSRAGAPGHRARGCRHRPGPQPPALRGGPHLSRPGVHRRAWRRLAARRASTSPTT